LTTIVIVIVMVTKLLSKQWLSIQRFMSEDDVGFG